MPKSPTLVAIDVGTTKVCTIIANVGDQDNIRVLGVGVVPSSGLSKGVVVNLDETKESIKASVKKAEHACGFKVESAYIGVTGRHINSLNNKGMIAVSKNDRKVAPADLKRVLESAKEITVSPDRKLLHVIPRKYALDGQPGIDDPVGMHGFRLDVETHIVTAATSSVQNLVKCIRGAGVEVEELVLEPLAAAEAVLTEDEMETGVILADIGGGTADIAIFKDGTVWHTSVLPVGGNQVTRDIAIGLGIPFEVAEEMKKKYANVMLTSVNHNAEVKDIRLEGNGQSIMQQDLCEIVHARMEEMLRMVLLELPRDNYIGLLPSGLVLTGGCSNLPGIENLAQEVLRLPVRIGAPKGMYGLADVLYDPSYSTGVGLLLWGTRHRGAEGWVRHGTAQKISHPFKRMVNDIKKRFA